jgi:hypothetical protein|nr:hypothetical protein [Neorhizobium tomejilense]
MQPIASAINRAFEALGSPIRAAVEDGDLFVRDIIVTPADDDGYVDIFVASTPDGRLHSFPSGDVSTIASVVAFHIARRIISTAVEE